MEVYLNLRDLREAFDQSPNDFPTGTVVRVVHPGSKRKTDAYRLETMIELRSSIPSLSWVYQHPPPKSRGGFNWDAYRQRK